MRAQESLTALGGDERRPSHAAASHVGLRASPAPATTATPPSLPGLAPEPPAQSEGAASPGDGGQ
eukprot:10773831-Alexandrium_andersonii.AAC.1